MKLWSYENGESVISPFFFSGCLGISEVVSKSYHLIFDFFLAAPAESISRGIVDLFGVASRSGPFNLIRRLVHDGNFSYDEIKYEDKSQNCDAFTGTHVQFGIGFSKDSLFGCYESGQIEKSVNGKVKQI